MAVGIERDQSEWRFAFSERDDAAAFFHEHGFVGFTDLVTPEELAALRGAYDDLVADGTVDVSKGMIGLKGAMLMHPEFDRFVRRSDIVAFVEGLVGRLVEIQHSKLNGKPLKDSGEGRIAWHQDYPFFPHTNHDLVAVGIHLDDEDRDEGPLLVVPGSHRAGPLSHVGPDGEFAYEVTDALPDDAEDRAVMMTGTAGQVTVHHCLTLHRSEPKRSDGQRRILITQYRARDAVQLAGVLWEETGLTVGGDDDGLRTARFTDGTVVDLRGRGGRLYDRYGKLAPDREG